MSSLWHCIFLLSNMYRLLRSTDLWAARPVYLFLRDHFRHIFNFSQSIIREIVFSLWTDRKLFSKVFSRLLSSCMLYVGELVSVESTLTKTNFLKIIVSRMRCEAEVSVYTVRNVSPAVCLTSRQSREFPFQKLQDFHRHWCICRTKEP